MPVFPLLRYRDADAALEWLERAFGFETASVHRGDDGAVAHAEVRASGGLMMLGQGEEHAGQGWVYVSVEDVDALHDRAHAAGAEITMALVDQDYGSREFAARDPEGNEWSFGTYAPE